MLSSEAFNSGPTVGWLLCYVVSHLLFGVFNLRHLCVPAKWQRFEIGMAHTDLSCPVFLFRLPSELAGFGTRTPSGWGSSDSVQFC